MTRLRFVLPLALAAFAFGQAPPEPNDALKQYLSLTDAQVQSLRQLRQQQMTNGRTTMQQMHEKQKALRDMLDKGTTDAAAVGKAMLEIEALRKQTQSAATSYRDQAVATLTADQKTKLKTLEEAAKLQPAMHQAMGLGLLAPGDLGMGGPGFMRMMGPGPMGAGPGPMGFRRQLR